MKSKLLLSLLLVVSNFAKAESKATCLVVWAKDGTKVAYALAEKPKVTFTETDLVITTEKIEVDYSLENMARFTYEEGNTTVSITNLHNEESPFRFNGESLLFPNLKTNSTVCVYHHNGTPVFKKTVSRNGEYALPLSKLSSGVYMVSVNGITYKIVKR